MSLLMQALKRAEHAKQKQNDPHEIMAVRDDAPVKPPHEPISLTPLEAPAISDAPAALNAHAAASVYPEIIAPAENARVIEPTPPDSVADALAQQPEPAPPDLPRSPAKAGLTLESPAPHAVSIAIDVPAPAPAPAATAAATAAPEATATMFKNPVTAADSRVTAAQKSARAVFASKQHPGARRMTLIAVAGITLAVSVTAGFGYYYWQTASGSGNFVIAEVPPPSQAASTEPSQENASEPAVAAVAPDMAAPGEPAAAPAKTAALSPAAVKEPLPAPEAVTLPASQAAASQPAASASSAGASRVAHREPEPAAGAAQSSSDTIRIRQGNNPNHIHPALADAYQLFSSGDMAAAQQQYRRVLRQEPNNRDALLGMAAIAINRKQPDQAGAFYAKLLELDPADADAMAGLASLKQGDPALNESSLKKILAQDSQAGAALFALGNLYAQQARWAEAQQYYFRAFGSAQDNADYAFNLAVSLDRLSQSKLALDYYQRALALSQNTQTSFDKSAVQRRAMDLKASIGN